MTNQVFDDYGESIFSVVSRLAESRDAVDLGQGYPNYPPPGELLRALETLPQKAENHQYANPNGLLSLRESLSDLYLELYGIDYSPREEITITSGATEAINSALMGLLNPGDEVVVFEPIYDQYVPVARRAGASVTVLSLDPDDYSLPVDELRETVTDRTSLILVNNPHNPTGKVFRREELNELVRVAEEYETVLLSDEVYEHLTYGGEEYGPLAGLNGARERTLSFGSAGKSFDATGWKIGWALGAEELIRSLRLAHQFTTYCSAAPLQAALGKFLDVIDPDAFFEEFRAQYAERRDLLLEGLKRSPFEPSSSSGSYFITATLSEAPESLDSAESRVRWIIDEFGVAAVPMQSFYVEQPPDRLKYRFAFCKPVDQLKKAADKLSR